jgi:hypothetical protein
MTDLTKEELDTALMNAAIMMRKRGNFQLATAIEDARKRLTPNVETSDRMRKALTVVVLNARALQDGNCVIMVPPAWMEAVTQLIIDSHQPAERVVLSS